MNFASVILVLQMALSLLTAPGLEANAQLKQQALSFASQAMSIADTALQQATSSDLVTPLLNNQSNSVENSPQSVTIENSTTTNQQTAVRSDGAPSDIPAGEYVANIDSNGAITSTTTDVDKGINYAECKLPENIIDNLRASGYNENSAFLFELYTRKQCPFSATHLSNTTPQ